MSTHRNEALGSDNWAITWAANGHQYTTWGDGGGFGGTNKDGRVSLGVGRVEGSKSAYSGFNVWGGKNPETPAQFTGKSYGLLSIGSTLYMWRCGKSSGANAFVEQALHYSTDNARTWNSTNVHFEQGDFSNSQGFFCPTFLQFGAGYSDARDSYVYSYAPEIKNTTWDAQKPGQLTLIRVPVSQISQLSSYQFFAGLSSTGAPTWSNDVNARKPVFVHPDGLMLTGVSHNRGLNRYLLVVQVASRFRAGNGRIGIYEAPEPWGPWRTIVDDSPWDLGIQASDQTVYWNFSNKWLSADGKDFVLVYTGAQGDRWGTVEGRFSVSSGPTNAPPSVTLTSPTTGAVFTAPATISLAASASDGDGTVAKVEFFRGTTKLGEDTTSPYSFTWSGAAAGNYSLTARAIDDDGAATTSAAVLVTIQAASSNAPPSVALTAPTSGSVFTAPATISLAASASDGDGTVTRVEFFRGTTKLGEDTTSPYAFTWSGVAAGSYSLTATATDDDGATASSAAVSVTVSDGTTSAGPLAYWPFEETGSTVVDASSNGNDGVLVGATRTTLGKNGNALSFDGIDDHVDLGGLDIPGNALTISAWFNANNFTTGTGDSDPRIISKATGTSTQNHYWMVGTWNVNGEIRLRFRLKTLGSTTNLVASTGSLQTGVWTHVAAVYDGSKMRLYKDGVEIGIKSKSGALDTNPSVDAAIGSNPGGVRTFNGRIDEVQIYDRALTPTDIGGLSSGASTVIASKSGPGADEVVSDLESTSTDSYLRHLGAETSDLPTEFLLKQNYPNPFNPNTTVSFDVPESALVLLEVYDLLGRRVAQLVNRRLEAGRYEIPFDATLLSSGIYTYRIQAGAYHATRHMVVLQ